MTLTNRLTASRPLRGLLALAVALPLTLPPTFAAAQSPLPCYERRVGLKRLDGIPVFLLRISPKPGKACMMHLDLAGRIRIDRVIVIDKPEHGRLVTVRPNRIVYKAGKNGERDAFALAFDGQNLQGHVVANMVFIVEPR
ncbi:hypothetical protein DLJ53_15270 [Acuticoccus sediminis]|uniref:Uncharacterized protein n=1 Tax=Acuticoccus sediminis TaxID=2184697 RepID=A0A8B2NLS0_9HYPH|nr:hypothetical protein [Acuticoccus sediminis]RAI00616.1 hypothetical protein DLJ53_15270 [Acuticoccus sediminis]